MPWTEWIAASHPLLAHLPIGVALALPWALAASLRPGKGIRPWWTTCRYLGWLGLLGGLAAAFSGILWARSLGLIAPEGFWAPRSASAGFRYHQALMAASLALGVLYLRVAGRKREDYQGFGVLPLFLGLLWSAATLTGSWYAVKLTGWPHPGGARPIAAAPAEQPPIPAPAPSDSRNAEDPEAQAPTRALDYLSLEPMHAEPVKSAPHGNRWIRVWANAAAAPAYRTGAPLPPGSFVVMSSQEDRWGRPGSEAGPLYALEVKADGKPNLTFYWPRVPEARRAEVGGEARVYWRHMDNPNLQSCLACHASGAAPAASRSRIVPFKRPLVKTAAE